jgi:hypothetical protein
MMSEVVTYTVAHSIGITPDNPTGMHIVEKQYTRQVYNNEHRTVYKDAVAKARHWLYVDFSGSEEDFKKGYEQEVSRILIEQERGGRSCSISQERWLNKVDNVNSLVEKMSTKLWNDNH